MKGLELEDIDAKEQAKTPPEPKEDIEVHDNTHDFISPNSQPLMKVTLIDERLSGDTGGTKPVLEVSQVIEKAPDTSI